MNTPGQNSNAVAELVFGLMITLARRGFSGRTAPSCAEEARHPRVRQRREVRGGDRQRVRMEVFAFDPYVPAKR